MKHVVETYEHGTTTIEFVSKFRMPDAIQCFEFKTNRDFEVGEPGNEMECSFFRLEIHETKGYATIAGAHEYGDGDENYRVFDSADHIFDVAQINVLAQTHKDEIRDTQDEYDEWAAEYDNDEDDADPNESPCDVCGKREGPHEPGCPDYEDDGEPYQQMIAERDKAINPRTADIDFGFDQEAPYAEIENWQWVLANINEMPHLFPGDTTDIERNIRETAEARIEWLMQQFPRIEQYAYDSEEAQRAHYLQDIAMFCNAWPGFQPDNGEIPIKREDVGTILRTLYAYKAEHGQMQCDGWSDGDYQEVTWEMYVEWMRDHEGQIPEEHQRFILV